MKNDPIREGLISGKETGKTMGILASSPYSCFWKI
jgi:hypothetical protein